MRSSARLGGRAGFRWRGTKFLCPPLYNIAQWRPVRRSHCNASARALDEVRWTLLVLRARRARARSAGRTRAPALRSILWDRCPTAIHWTTVRRRNPGRGNRRSAVRCKTAASFPPAAGATHSRPDWDGFEPAARRCKERSGPGRKRGSSSRPQHWLLGQRRSPRCKWFSPAGGARRGF